jgi:hypothetical protein
VARKVKVEVTQPVHDPDGNVVYQPGTQFEQDDPALKDLPPGHVREVIVDEPAKTEAEPAKTEAKPAVKATAKAKETL